MIASLALASAGVARASTDQDATEDSEARGRRHTLFEIDRGLPAGGYLKLGRFAPSHTAEPDDGWLDRRSRWSRKHSLASIERTFMAVEAGKDEGSLRGFVSAAGESQSGVLEPRFAANAYRRWGSVGRFSNVSTSAAVGTGTVRERKFYAYSGSSRFSVGPLDFLGYGALVDTERSRGFTRSWNARAEAGWRLASRLETRFAYEWLDPDDERRGDERTRVGVRLAPLLSGPMRGELSYRQLRGPGEGSAARADELAFEVQVSF